MWNFLLKTSHALQKDDKISLTMQSTISANSKEEENMEIIKEEASSRGWKST